MSAAYRLILLGMPQVRSEDDRVVRFRSKKHLALLVYLALHKRDKAVQRERLADFFWPDVERRHALQSLRQGLSDLRVKLGSDALAASYSDVRLLIDITADLDAELRGTDTQNIPPPLENLESCGSWRFAHWVEVTRDRMMSQIRSTLSAELSTAHADGRVEAVHERAEQLYSVDPYDETALQVLLEKRLSSGDRPGALRLCRKRILDLEESPVPSAQMLASLRRFERALFHNAPVAPEQEPGLSEEPKRPEVFVGRESQLDRLNALCGEVRNGRFRTCEIRGPDGIGKSSLLHRFSLLTTARGVPGFTVSCQEIGANIPYAAVSDLLDQMLRDSSVGGTDRIWLAEASRVAPGIRTVFTGIDEPPETPPETVRVRLGEAITKMLEAVADGGPMFLVFDDMHYMDPASREVLHP